MATQFLSVVGGGVPVDLVSELTLAVGTQYLVENISEFPIRLALVNPVPADLSSTTKGHVLDGHRVIGGSRARMITPASNDGYVVYAPRDAEIAVTEA